MTIYSYYRFSELEQVQASGSLDAMIETEQLIIGTHCLRKQWVVAEALKDQDVSWNLDFSRRINGLHLLNLVRQDDIIVSSSLDRIFSSCHDAVTTIEILKQKGVALHIVQLGGDITDPDYMVNFERVARMFSSLEKRRSAERIKGVKHKQKSKGRYLGGSRPFGYMIHDNGRLIENPMEQKVLKRIVQLKAQGKSLRAISKEVSTPMVPISFKTVQRLLQRHGDAL
jgi:DNA invertase Pin-like site-specific DNA recombinase